jgi:hypothetical protein
VGVGFGLWVGEETVVVMHTKEGGQVWALWRSKNRCREALASFFVSSLGAPGNTWG